MSDEQQSNQNDHFGQLNFHPAHLRQEIRDWLIDPAGLPLVLQGEHGIGREYCLRTACFNQKLHDLPWTVLSVDLALQHNRDLKELTAWLATQSENKKKGLNLLALLAEAFPGIEQGIATGDALSLTLVFSVTGIIKFARALLSACTIPTESLPDNNPSNALRRLLERILVECNLILHFRNADQVDMGTANLFLTLGDLLDQQALEEQQQGRLLLAFACSANVRPVELLGRRREHLKILSVEGLTIGQLRQCMQNNFSPNRFSEELLSALHFSGRAKEEDQLCAPGSIASAVNELLGNKVLIWEKDCWIINQNVSEKRINTVIGLPLCDLYRERLAGIAPELRPLAEDFMRLAGLCRQWIPQQLLLAYMGLDDATGDCLLDSLEEVFIEQKPALLIDEEGRYPGFTKNAIYRFTFPLLAVSLRPRKGSKEPEKLLAFLAEQMQPNDRAMAALCWQLAEQAESNVQEQWREKLAWFFAPELAEQFADMLLAKLQAGLLAPGALLERAKNEHQQQPLHFLQAIISACDRWYQAQGGVPNNQDGALFLSLFGLLLTQLGRYEDALVKHQLALAMRQLVLPKNHPDIGSSFNNIGLVLNNLGCHEEALVTHEAALAILQRVLPEDKPNIASILNNIGLVLNDFGRHEEALVKHEAALAIKQRVLPEDHLDIANSLSNIGLVLDKLGRYEEALAKHEASAISVGC
ncbi:tetratricopeptide repeat protein [Candidatus Electronema sp. PJ]|uniref:tetratricopeptide repeat protein n=1 Tax=Candidatus Electronema sp. PJ TaxID=3401572 RepID=UPI003AA96C87